MIYLLIGCMIIVLTAVHIPYGLLYRSIAEDEIIRYPEDRIALMLAFLIGDMLCFIDYVFVMHILKPLFQ